jgi:RNA polymerase sigma-70 factor (ECF subfamily)
MADAGRNGEARAELPHWRSLGRRRTRADARAEAEAAFADHFGEIHRYFHRRVGRDNADDLAAETFLRAWRGWRGYDPARGAVRPWLYGIATKLLSCHYRDEQRRLRAYARASVEPPGAAAPQDHRVAAALADLSPRDRDLVLLHAWAGLTYEEIAQALGIPIGTVRSRLHRIRSRIRELLEVESTTTQ